MQTPDVVIKHVPARRLFSVRGIVPRGGSIPDRFTTVMAGMAGFPHADRLGPCVAYYYSPPDQDMDIEIGFEAGDDFNESFTLPNGEVAQTRVMPAMPTAAVMVYKGSYSRIGEAWEAMMGWIEANGYVLSGPCCEVYLNDPQVTPEEELLTELQAPVQKR
ncbi:MAG: hypothetical protein Kow0077_21320 [Anaerolineae bacterium]